MAKKIEYVKPEVKEEKIEVSLFLNSRFIDSAVAQLVQPVFAQSGADCQCGCGSCTCSGCGTEGEVCDCQCGCYCSPGGNT